MNDFKDYPSDAAYQLQQEMIQELGDQNPVEPEGSVEESTRLLPYRSLYQKINFKWSVEDQAALSQLRVAVDQLVTREFDQALDAIDSFYLQVRIYETSEDGVVLLDHEGRPRWKKDSVGNYVENWDNLTGQDLEKSLFDLERVRFVTAQRVQELFLEAVFAKHVMSDDWHGAYEAVVQGTQADRTAKANRETREQKYHSFYRYYLWSRADSLQKEIVHLQRLMEKVIEWRIWRKDNRE